MKPDERDLAYLWDMLDAARRVERLIAGMDYAGFADDERTSLATERLLENIGEAARNVSPTLQQRHPEIPWSGIIGMRNILAHQYGVVDQRKVWQAATNNIRELILVLEAFLSETPSPPPATEPPARYVFDLIDQPQGRDAY